MSTTVELQHEPKGLPDEILLHILLEFEVSRSTWEEDLRLNMKTLYNACLASKQLSGVARTILYRSLEGHTYDVAQSLSKSPQLCNMVQRLYFPLFDHSPIPEILIRDPRPDWYKLLSRVPNLPKSVVGGIRQAVYQKSHYCFDTALAFWLAILPKLKRLVIEVGVGMPLMTALVRHYLEFEPARFFLLSGMRLNTSQDLLSRSIGCSAILFQLPFLKVLDVGSLPWVDGEDGSDFLLPPNAFPRLECFTAHWGLRISPKSLKNLLQTCKRLRQLAIRICKPYEIRYDPHEYELGNWLRSYCQNLEYLDIHLDLVESPENNDTVYFEEHEWVVNVLGSLQGLTNLKVLALSADFGGRADSAGDEDSDGPQLDLVEMLPTSINSLCIDRLGRTHPNRITDSLCRLATSEKHPNLCSVVVVADSTLPRDVSPCGWSVSLSKWKSDGRNKWRHVRMFNKARQVKLSPLAEV